MTKNNQVLEYQSNNIGKSAKSTAPNWKKIVPNFIYQWLPQLWPMNIGDELKIPGGTQ